jgi:hypothetical protein
LNRGCWVAILQSDVSTKRRLSQKATPRGEHRAWTTIAADFASRRSLWELVTPECAKRAGPRWMRLVLCVPFRTVRYWGRLRMEARRHASPGTPINGGREIAQISQLAAVSMAPSRRTDQTRSGVLDPLGSSTRRAQKGRRFQAGTWKARARLLGASNPPFSAPVACGCARLRRQRGRKRFGAGTADFIWQRAPA